MAIPSRGDAANAMTSTYIVDTNLAPTQLEWRQSKGIVPYDVQRAWLRPGVPTLHYNCNNARLGLGEPRAYAGSTTPIIAMAMWNAHNEQHLGNEVNDDSEPPFVAFTGFVRECNPGSIGSAHTGRRLWTLSTNAGGMVSSDLSDNIVRTAPDLPIVAGNPLILVRMDLENPDGTTALKEFQKGSFFALLCDNGICDTKKPDVKAFFYSAAKVLNSGTSYTAKARDWACFGKVFCNLVRCHYSSHLSGKRSQAIEISPLGRIGRAIWLSSEVPSDETAVALAHFSNEGDTRGRLDVVLCSA